MGWISARRGALLAVPVSLVVLFGCAPSRASTAPVRAATQSVEATAAASRGAERAAVLVALSRAVENEVGQRVSIVDADVGIGGAYALVNFAVKRPDGSEIDWAAIPQFAAAYEAGAFDEYSEALLHKRGPAWKVVEVRIGPTDTKRGVWTEQFEIPPLSTPPE